MSSPARLILCPQCHHSFPIPVGTVTACPRCGKVVVIPRGETEPTPPPAIPVEHQSSLPVVCKICGSRYYAKPREMGQSLPCPDCHTANIVVPISSNLGPGGALRPAPPPTPASNPGGDDDDEFNLSAPVELPKDRTFTSDGSHMEAMQARSPYSNPAPFPYKTPAPPVATFTPPSVAPPPPIVSHSPPVSPPAAAPVPLQPAATVQGPVTTQRRAWSDVKREPTPSPTRSMKPLYSEKEKVEKKKNPTDRYSFSRRLAWLEQHPFTLGIIPIFRQTQVFTRWMTVTILASAQLVMLWSVKFHLNSTDTSEQILGMLMYIAMLFSVFPTLMALSSFSLTVFGDTANGNTQISSWPEFNFVEWFMGSMYFLGAFIVSGLPGVVIGLFLYGYSSTSLANSLLVGIPTLAFSWYCFFPLIFISMQETGTVLEPFSVTLLNSLLPLKFRWVAFYGISLLLIVCTLVVLAPLLFFGFESSALPLALGALIPSAFLITAFPVVYFRFLGKIAMLYRDYNASLDDESSPYDESEIDIQALAIRRDAASSVPVHKPAK